MPADLVVELIASVPDEEKGNLNRLITRSLREFVQRRKIEAFETALAEMAADTEVQRELAAVGADFDQADGDGLA